MNSGIPIRRFLWKVTLEVMELTLKTPITALRGIGDARASLFAKLGLLTAGDLLHYFPRGYEDRSKVKPIFSIADGEICSAVVTVCGKPREAYGKNGMFFTRAVFCDETGSLTATFFNNRWIARSLVEGRRFRLYGRFTFGIAGKEIVSPVAEPADGKELEQIVPLYPLTKGLTHQALRAAVKQVLPLAEQEPEILPESFRTEQGLIGRQEALRAIHFPTDITEKEKAVNRLAFEELLIFQLSLKRLRREGDCRPAWPLALRNSSVRNFFEALPFPLTGAQQRVIREITDDLKKATPMMRLVQGDVGSGKTVVAAYAIYLAVRNGKQAVMMAPTEILAGQHARTLEKLLTLFGIRVVFLSGSLSAKEKKILKQQIASGEADVAVGTNALIQADVSFADLALAVTDEQHRFGVQQRAALISKGSEGRVPHTLVMSATPIPRTLSLILYGDLDLSAIDELPPGRQKVDTFALDERYRERVQAFMQKQVAEGHQAYVVCPLVAETEGIPLRSAEEHVRLLRAALPGITAEVLHGKTAAAKKQEIMRRFSAGEINVLVSTTVVEVGVDVPNATLMVVENAEQFGLSTLHQLRGRVGRGKAKSYCILLYDKETPHSKERLDTMTHTNDGFEIASADLAQRGPGDLFGERQSGEFRFRVASIADLPLVEKTRIVTETIEQDGLLDRPEYHLLNEAASALYQQERAKNTIN